MGWHGGGVGGDLAATKKPGETCIYSRVDSLASLLILQDFMKKENSQESLGVNLFLSCGPPFLPHPCTVVPTDSLLLEYSFIRSSYSLSSCLHRTLPGAMEEIGMNYTQALALQSRSGGHSSWLCHLFSKHF